MRRKLIEATDWGGLRIGNWALWIMWVKPEWRYWGFKSFFYDGRHYALGLWWFSVGITEC